MQNETVQQTTEKELTFRTMFTVLKKHALWISIVAIIAAIVVGVLTAALVPVKFVGTTTFWVNNVSEKGDYIQSTMVSASAALAENYTQVVTQKVTLKKAIANSSLDKLLVMDEYDTIVYLQQHITTSHKEESVMFDPALSQSLTQSSQKAKRKKIISLPPNGWKPARKSLPKIPLWQPMP